MDHKVNYDAINEGVFAFLITYPDETALDARCPLKAPRGAHAILWVDDFYRGVDMAREAFESIVGRWRSMRTEEIAEPRRAQAVSERLDKVVRATRTLVEARLTHGVVHDEVRDEADGDLADVLAHVLSNIAMSGDADRWDEHGRETDVEIVHDGETEA